MKSLSGLSGLSGLVSGGAAPFSMSAPTGYWPMSNANDVTAGARNFITSGSITYGAGKVGNAATYGISAKHYRFSDSGIALNSSSRSLSVGGWMDIRGYNIGLNKQQSSSVAGWRFETVSSDGDKIRFSLYDNSGVLSAYAETTITLSTFTFQHYIGVIDRTAQVLRIYKDGVLAATSGTIAAVTTTNDSSQLTSQGHGGNAGRIDEVGLWMDTILSDDEVAYLYNSGSGRTYDGATWS